LEQSLLDYDFNNFRDTNIRNFFKNFGIDTGNLIMEWLGARLTDKGFSMNVTFKKLFRERGVDFRVVATNLNSFDYTVFSKDTTPNLRVLKAIRMSIGIPLVFTIKRYRGDIYVDGSVINNYPVHLFDKDRDKILGVRICYDQVRREVSNIRSYLYNLFLCIASKRHDYSGYDTISINIDDNPINFDLTRVEKEKIIDIGYNRTVSYFSKIIEKCNSK
jgi:predicted acylesterase/phospholipase RssA